jgi:subtilisin family serine protease
MRCSLTVSSHVRIVVYLTFCFVFLISSLAPFASTKSGTHRAKASPQSTSRAPRRTNELLVRFRGVQSQLQKDQVAAAHGLRRKRTLGAQSGFEKLELASASDVDTAVLQLLLDPAVEFAEPNFLINHDQLATQPNDPRFGEQWSLRNIGQDGGQYGADIEASAGWQTSTGAANVVIAIVDSGIDFNHPDLVENLSVHGWDFVEDSSVIKDEQGHGTAVAGIVAASGNNGVGVAGVMWRASLMSLRVLDETGTGDVAAAVEAIDYAIEHGAHVINLSWGTTGESSALKEAIQRALRQNVVVVCSAGNSSQDIDSTPYYPASFNVRDLIAVAASDGFDQLASWSNWGRKNVAVAAPGVNILTTQKGGGYWNVTGTSAAAPLVTGVVGLLTSSKPWLSVHAISQALDKGARDVTSLAGKLQSEGVVNTRGAFESLQTY